MRIQVLTATALGMLAAACQPAAQGIYLPPQSPSATVYGTNYPSAPYAARDYSEAGLTNEARNACTSYGLQPSFGAYDECVGRELDARRSQATGQYRADQYGNRIDAQGYRVDGNGYRLPQQSSDVEPSSGESRGYVEPNVGQQVTRDEYGFRYDAYGNRVDRYGHVISPQSKTP
jgi:hypothetical protein